MLEALRHAKRSIVLVVNPWPMLLVPRTALWWQIHCDVVGIFRADACTEVLRVLELELCAVPQRVRKTV